MLIPAIEKRRKVSLFPKKYRQQCTEGRLLKKLKGSSRHKIEYIGGFFLNSSLAHRFDAPERSKV